MPLSQSLRRFCRVSATTGILESIKKINGYQWQQYGKRKKKDRNAPKGDDDPEERVNVANLKRVFEQMTKKVRKYEADDDEADDDEADDDEVDDDEADDDEANNEVEEEVSGEDNPVAENDDSNGLRTTTTTLNQVTN